MNRSGDVASCSVLAAVLTAGAARLRSCENPEGGPDPTDVTALTESLDALGGALHDFATALRDPRPPRSGLAHPHRALATACREILNTLTTGDLTDDHVTVDALEPPTASRDSRPKPDPQVDAPPLP